MRSNHALLVLAVMLFLSDALPIVGETDYPRVTCTHYNIQDQVHPRSEVCTYQRQGEDDRLPVDFYCQTTWINNSKADLSNLDRSKVLMQGCIPVYNDHDGDSDQHSQCKNKTQCVSNVRYGEGKGDNKTVHFCCCDVSDCNSKFQWIPAPVPIPDPIPSEPTLSYSVLFLQYASVPCLVVILSIVVAAVFYVRHSRQKPAKDPSPSPTLIQSPVDLVNGGLLARGRYGDVWKGQIGSELVAVKIFQNKLQEKKSWATEKDIYEQPQLSHENILKFWGAERREEENKIEFWLITTFHELGSLYDFLKNHVLNIDDLIKICLTMTRGLAHLHKPIPSTPESDLKPSIAHRDFKSKNVLIKSDMTACIGDFGLALPMPPDCFSKKSENWIGDTHSQVGTRRYMAPEVLEGAINFNEEAFRKIDMYACGLVLWEIVSRCKVEEQEEQPYRLPFEAESCSPNPSIEEMVDLVVNRKVRPKVSQIWREHPIMGALCSTIEETWDHDVDARLTSWCVLDRIQRIQMEARGDTKDDSLDSLSLDMTQPDEDEKISIQESKAESSSGYSSSGTDASSDDSSSV